MRLRIASTCSGSVLHFPDLRGLYLGIFALMKGVEQRVFRVQVV